MPFCHGERDAGEYPDAIMMQVSPVDCSPARVPRLLALEVSVVF